MEYSVSSFSAMYSMDTIDPWIGNNLGFIPIFRNLDLGGGAHLTLAAVILTIMVLPTIVALSQDAMKAVPQEYRKLHSPWVQRAGKP